MIDWNARKEEIKNIILGCIEGNQNWPDDMTDEIIAQEQSMIGKLEADKAEMLETLKSIDLFTQISDDRFSDYSDSIHLIIQNIINKISGE